MGQGAKRGRRKLGSGAAGRLRSKDAGRLKAQRMVCGWLRFEVGGKMA